MKGNTKHQPWKACGQMVTDLAEPRKLNPKSAAGKARTKLIYSSHQEAQNWWLWTRKQMEVLTESSMEICLRGIFHFPSQTFHSQVPEPLKS